MKRRVVVTGIGVVTPLGCDLDTFRRNLLGGVSAAAPIRVFDPATLPTRIAAQVDEKALALKPGEERILERDRKVAFAVAAARAAVADTGGLSGQGAGLSVGLGLELFSMPDLVHHLSGAPAPAGNPTYLQTPSDVCVHLIGREHGLTAPPLTHISACAASTDAIGAAYRLIAEGRRSWMIAGGADSMINPMGVAGFCKISAMSSRNGDPTKASRPFDRERDGFLLGEGAAFVVLEPLEAAKARGARVYGELGGYGSSFDAHGISEPHPGGDGALAAMSRALKDAGVSPDEVVYVNAHGTSTPKNDPVETLGLKRLLGARAKDVPVSSTKSMLGHTISAAGAVELAASLVCAQEGKLHGTINLENPDPACDLDYAAEGPRPLEDGWCLKNSFGFGGQNACVAFKPGAPA